MENCYRKAIEKSDESIKPGDVRIIEKLIHGNTAFCTQEYIKFCGFSFWKFVAKFYNLTKAIEYAEELRTDILNNNIVWCTWSDTDETPTKGDFRVIRKRQNYIIEEYDKGLFGFAWIFVENYATRGNAISEARTRFYTRNKKVLWLNGKRI